MNNHKETNRTWMREWRRRNPEEAKKRNRLWRFKNIEKARRQTRESAKRVFLADPEKAREKTRTRVAAWRNKNRPQYRKLARELHIKNYSNPNYRIKHRLRSRLFKMVTRRMGLKEGKTIDFLGCSISDFKIYLESKFDVGMSWDNLGDWHIDHIMPCALFDLSKPDHQKRCFHFSNLQPLWAIDNRRKWKHYPYLQRAHRSAP